MSAVIALVEGRGLGRREHAKRATAGLVPPLVSCAYGQLLSKVHVVEVFPHGVKTVAKGLVRPAKRGGGKRGEIDGFSPAAASRLRDFCVTREVPGRVPLSFTCTTKGLMTPKQWRASWKRFRTRARAAGVPFVYRVELQKRKAPHVHGVAWVNPVHQGHEEHRRLFWEGWLECVKEQDDPDSRRHAVDTRIIENHGWLVYIALHHGKHKGAQLGWEGKQWGVVGGEMFKRRAALTWQMTDGERYRFQRIMRRVFALPKGPTAVERAALLACPDMVWRPQKRAPRVLPSAQTWLRCIESGVVNRVLCWVTGRQGKVGIED